MTLIATGGNVKVNGSVNPGALKSVGWQWINCRGRTGRRVNWWFKDAMKQGAEITRGSYHYNPFTGRLRVLNLEVTGSGLLIDALRSITDNYLSR